MLPLVFGFGAGAAIVHWLPRLLPAPASLLFVLGGALLWRRRRALAALLIALAWTSFQAGQLLARDWPCTRDREDIALTVAVAAPPVRREGAVELDFDVLEPRDLAAGPGRLRLTWYDAPTMPRPGQLWRLKARLRCRHGFANGVGTDRELTLLRQRIVATGYLRNDPPPVLLPGTVWRHPLERLRDRVATDIAAALPGSPSAGVLQGLAVGLRGSIPEELWDAFAATGTAHLIAISGLHVTAFALVVLLLLRAAWRVPGCPGLHRRIGVETVLVVAATTGYALLAGASLPTLRTLVMVVLVAGARLLRRPALSLRTLALAALLLVAADPLAVASAGFWLSFVATWALLALGDPGRGRGARLLAFARAQLAMFFVLAPLLAVAFGRLSLIAPLANAVVIPLFSVLLLPVTLLGTAAVLPPGGSGAPAWSGLGGLLDHCWPWLIAAGRLPGATWAPAGQPLPVVAATAAMIVLALLLPLRGPRLAAAVMLGALLCGNGPRPPPAGWQLTVLDVGQGLAAVVRTRAHVLVFDTGPRWRGGGSAARTVLLPWLRYAGIRRIDRLVLSHSDADHAGGAATLRAGLPVAQVLAGADVTGGDELVRCVAGQHWQWDGVQFEVLHPPAGFSGSDNEGSCALAIRAPGGRALLLADAEEQAEALLAGQQREAEVVLLPHHGSRSSSTRGFIAALGARVGIAAAGFGNQWDLPHAEVVARWRAAGTTVLTTAIHGAITVTAGAAPGELRVTAARAVPRWWQRRDAARYHAGTCGKSSSPAARSCGRS